MRLHNFFRFGETKNSFVFDILPDDMALINNDELTFDGLYDQVMGNPVEYVNKVKAAGINSLIGISGVIGSNTESSNGAGKSTILEGFTYALYNKIIRKNVNSDKKSDAGFSVVLNFNGEYPKTMTDSYVEILFEEKDKLYTLKRGRSFTKNQKDKGPYLFFENVSVEDGSESSHRTGSTNEAIVEAIGLEYDIFCSGLMFGQNDSGKFLIGTDKIKKDMLINILHLEDVVDGCLERVRRKKNDKIKEIDTHKSKFDLITERLADKKSVPELRNEIKESEVKISELDERVKYIEKESEELSKSDKLKLVMSIKEEGTKVKEEMQSRQKHVDSQIESWEKLREESVKSANSFTSQITDGMKKQSQLVKASKVKKEEVEEFNGEEHTKDLAKVAKAKLAKPKYENRVNVLREEKEKLVKSIAASSAEKYIANKEQSIIQEQLDTVGDEEEFVCDKCKSTVEKAHILAENKKLQDAISELKSKISGFEGEKVEKETALKDAEDKLKIVNNWINKEHPLLANKKEHESAKIRVGEIEKDIAENYTSLDNLRKSLESEEKKGVKYLDESAAIVNQNKSEIDNFKAKLSDLAIKYKDAELDAKSIAAKLEEYENTQKVLTYDRNGLYSSTGSLKKEIEDILADEKTISETKETIELENKTLARYLVLEDVFGLEGVQTRIVKKYLPLLNTYIKEVMDILSSGTMEEKIVVNSSSKIEIEIRGGSAQQFFMLSGGEKMIIRLATDIGLAMLSFSRSTQKPEIICLDEIFGPLDPVHTERVFDLLDKLSSKFNRVIVISHKNDINRIIENKIIVGKDPGEYGLSFIKDIV